MFLASVTNEKKIKTLRLEKSLTVGKSLKMQIRYDRKMLMHGGQRKAMNCTMAIKITSKLTVPVR
jgi:hypothetical protein